MERVLELGTRHARRETGARVRRMEDIMIVWNERMNQLLPSTVEKGRFGEEVDAGKNYDEKGRLLPVRSS